MNTLLALIITLCLTISNFGFSDSNKITFNSPEYFGSGCPKDSVAFLATDDAFTLTFSNYSSETGPQINRKLRFRNCHIRILVTAPSGFIAKVDTLDYRGYTALEKNTFSMISSFYTLGSQQIGYSKPKIFHGEGEFDFIKQDKTLFFNKNKCSNSKPVRLDIYNSLTTWGANQKSGFITLDSLDGVIEARLQLIPCR